MADRIDVKDEGRKLTGRQQQAMRDTAEDEEYARKKRTQKGWGKKAAQDHEIVDIMTTDPNTAERKRAMRRDEYLIRTTGNDRTAKRKTRSAGSAKLRAGKRVKPKK